MDKRAVDLLGEKASLVTVLLCACHGWCGVRGGVGWMDMDGAIIRGVARERDGGRVAGERDVVVGRCA